MRSDLPTRRAPASLGLRFGQVWTPGHDPHIERQRVAGHARPEAPEADDSERLAGEAYADRHAALEAAGAHGPVGGGNGAGGGDHQAKRQFGRRVGSASAACCVADHHALTRASLDVQRRVRSAGDADHAKFGKTADKAFGKSRALTHGQENVEIRESDGSVVFRPKSVSEKRQTSARAASWTSRRCSVLRPANHRELQFSPSAPPTRPHSVGPAKIATIAHQLERLLSLDDPPRRCGSLAAGWRSR